MPNGGFHEGLEERGKGFRNLKRPIKQPNIVGWKVKSFDPEALLIALDGYPINTGCAEEQIKDLMRRVTHACDTSMPRKRGINSIPSVHWWNDHISVLRKEYSEHDALMNENPKQKTPPNKPNFNSQNSPTQKERRLRLSNFRIKPGTFLVSINVNKRIKASSSTQILSLAGKKLCEDNINLKAAILSPGLLPLLHKFAVGRDEYFASNQNLCGLSLVSLGKAAAGLQPETLPQVQPFQSIYTSPNSFREQEQGPAGLQNQFEVKVITGFEELVYYNPRPESWISWRMGVLVIILDGLDAILLAFMHARSRCLQKDSFS
ncbi:Protein of unknown function [Cotesia congregata]|uniref:Uncharacterized protein n=1 Tax=Cotesia congregata TaxID=51543 RepID=A0A8J2H7V4_COTCN|nr:Protein of unknown function [Cotesia congregata]